MRQKENRYIVVLLTLFLLLTAGYGATQRLSTPVVIVHTLLDDWIPFCEWFVIPYVMWYGLLAGSILFFLFVERETLRKMLTMMVLGLAVSTVIFVVCPNGIDFRPETFPRENVLTNVVGWLYQNDQPENVCPSIHVLHSLSIWAAVHHSPLLRQHRWVEPACAVLAVLICLSTVFIKQHSVVDIAASTILNGVLYVLIYRWKRKTDGVTI